MDEKVLGDFTFFSTRLPCSNKKTSKKYFSVMNIEFKTIEEMPNKIQKLRETKKIRISSSYRWLLWSNEIYDTK